MKKLFFLLLLVPTLLQAQPDPNTVGHTPGTYVYDYAEVLTSAEEAQLQGLIASFFDTVQMALVYIPTFGDWERAEYTTALGQHWGVGGKSSNGLTIVIAINDRKMFVATGRGVEAQLPDALVVNLQKQYATSRFKEGNYFQGAYDLIKAYQNELSPSARELREVEAKEQARLAAQWWSDFWDIFQWFVYAGILGLAVWYGRWRDKQHKRKLEAERRRVEQELQRQEREEQYKKQQAIWAEQQRQDKIKRQQERKRQNEELLKKAKEIYETLPVASVLYVYSHPMKDQLLKQYYTAVDMLHILINAKDYDRIQPQIQHITELLTTIKKPVEQLVQEKKEAEARQKELEEQKKKQAIIDEQNRIERQKREAEEAERRRKRRQQEEEEEAERRRRDSYNSSISSDSSSSSSDFGGGSYGGGGGGSDW